MKPILFAVMLCIAAFADAAPYQCPPSLGPSQVGCTFKSIGGTTTFTARLSLQATGSGAQGSAIAMVATVDALPCFSNFDAPVSFGESNDSLIRARNVNGSCTFDVTSKRPAELIAVGFYFYATPIYIELNAESVAFVPDVHLGVTTAGTGTGTVVSADGQINCGFDCEESYPPSSTITLTAAAAAGSIFTGWDGNCSGTTTTCTLLMSDTKNVTANFTIANPPPVVEFYNSAMDHYFITGDPAEAASVDAGGAGPGWSRTGLSFKPGGNVPACRFYGSITPGPNSHFYSAVAAECNFLKQIQATTPATVARWNYEGIAFSTSLPAAGMCPAATVPVYRAYNNGFVLGKESNHRFTTDPNALQQVLVRGWKFEGVVMCAPQ